MKKMTDDELGVLEAFVCGEKSNMHVCYKLAPPALASFFSYNLKAPLIERSCSTYAKPRQCWPKNAILEQLPVTVGIIKTD